MAKACGSSIQEALTEPGSAGLATAGCGPGARVWQRGASLTHDGEQHLAAADARSLLHLALVGARVGRLEARQVDGGVAVLGVGRVEVGAALRSEEHTSELQSR